MFAKFGCVLCCCILLFVFGNVRAKYGRQGFKDADQDWGFVNVRPDAYMFWWLYYTTDSVANYTERPLMIWLQGGPGMPSSGYGVFSEIGPLDVHLQPREYHWSKDFNVLFLDNPVGVGYSYLVNNASRATNNEEIGRDLVKCLEIFLSEHPEFQTVPTYMFGESYGGKMVVEFAYQLNLRRRREKINCNLKAIGLGDSYISPVDYTSYYAPVTYHLGLIDENMYNQLERMAEDFRKAYDEGKYLEALYLDRHISYKLEKLMRVDWYNFLEKMNDSLPSSLWKHQSELTELMNNDVKSALRIPDEIEWQFLSSENYESLKEDFLKSVTGRVETLLNSTDIKVIVYNGVLDLIVSTAGTAAWINKLNWKHSDVWKHTTQTPFDINYVTEGYVKEVDNLISYTILRAGHSVPIDNPAAMDYILNPLKAT